MNEYSDKFETSIKNSYFHKLNSNEQLFIREKATEMRFSHQEIRQIIEMAVDLNMWDEGSIITYCGENPNKKAFMKSLRTAYENVKNRPNSYEDFSLKNVASEQKFTFHVEDKESLGLGMCPVASPKTRCCNLLTLDAVESCGFDCSYCSIQSFYNQNKITFDGKFADKLLNLNLDPNKTYHIGTGQSSDSLMFGNREGVLDALMDFARSNPNVLLEFKTKSDNIKYLLENELPKNILITFSINTQIIIDNEEHLSASLDKRIRSARRLADKGVKVGFHFHPIVQYENYLSDYGDIYARLIKEFKVDEVALVSFGTLTFIKPVIKQLRERGFKSKILQMPFEDASGKASYPLAIKKEMFTHAYKSFEPWHKKVFFYMCMEDHSLWDECFGYNYSTNEDFERAMLGAYCEKVGIDYLL